MNPRKDEAAAYYVANRAAILERNEQWRRDNRERVRAAARRRYAENAEKHRQKNLAYDASNRESINAKAREYRLANPAAARGAVAEYRRRNKHQFAMHASARRAKIRKATAAWSDRQLVADIYRYARIMREHGVDCHVDHIIPLSGRGVRGLHVHDNLTVLLAEDNVRKSNRLEAIKEMK